MPATAFNLCYNRFMFKAGSLTFQEFAMNESLPLAVIQEAVLEFLRDRDDAIRLWHELVRQEIRTEDEDSEF
jgi:hypothetical protein